MTPDKPAFGEIWMKFPAREGLLGWLGRVIPAGPVTVTAIDQNAFDPSRPVPLLFAIGDPAQNRTLTEIIGKDTAHRAQLESILELLERRTRTDYQGAIDQIRDLLRR